MADRLLLTKTDLAEPARRQALEARLAALNPSAPLIPVAQGAVDPARLFNLGFFDPATKSVDVRRWLRDEAFAAGHQHHHDEEHADPNRHDDRIRAFCITRERPISWAVLSGWLDGLATMRGDDLLAVQGDRGAQRPAGPAGGAARRAAPLSPAGAAAAMAERGPPHPHGVHHPRPAAGGDRGGIDGLREGGRRAPRTPVRRRKPAAGGSRREFLVAAASVAATTAFAGPARAVMGPDDKFDLVIKGGDVLDPSQSLRGRRDIGIRYGVVEAVEPEIPAARALRVLDARASS